MHITVTAVHQVAIAGCLIAIGSRLLPTRRGLVSVRPLLVSLRGRLVAIRERLIILKRLRNRNDDLLLYLGRPERGIHETIV
ncbi:MAG: hypothetical protein ABI323_00745 [Solirubrobacteraceae bacterium]